MIPVLLLQNGGLVKSIKFKNHQYVGDPINAVRIFNEKEVDEIVVLDISATPDKRSPNIEQLSELAGEAFMPFAYGEVSQASTKPRRFSIKEPKRSFSIRRHCEILISSLPLPLNSGPKASSFR